MSTVKISELPIVSLPFDGSEFLLGIKDGESFRFAPTNIGKTVTTSDVMALLSNQITTSELSNALNSRINLIDGDFTLAGSVAARIKEVRDYASEQISYAQNSINQAQLQIEDVQNTASNLLAQEALQAQALLDEEIGRAHV